MAGVPLLSSARALEEALAQALSRESGTGPVPLRIIRIEGSRALVEIPHTAVPIARVAFNRRIPDPRSPRTWEVATRRTYGTLRKGKVWLVARRSVGPSPTKVSAPT